MGEFPEKSVKEKALLLIDFFSLKIHIFDFSLFLIFKGLRRGCGSLIFPTAVGGRAMLQLGLLNSREFIPLAIFPSGNKWK